MDGTTWLNVVGGLCSLKRREEMNLGEGEESTWEKPGKTLINFQRISSSIIL